MKKIFLVIISLIIFAAFLFYSENRKSNIDNYQPVSNFDKGPVPADEWFERQRAFPFDEIPQEEYLKSIEYVKSNMTLKELDNSSVWTLAGPTNVEGRITTVAIHPVNPQIVYAGAANGGVWKSTNFCQSWTSVFDDQNTSSIGALAIDPVNPEIIYCGTGEANTLGTYYPGTGIYKSTNGGTNWVYIGLDSTYCTGNISINPINNQEIYVASLGSIRRKNEQRGIYKSVNGGLNWTRSLFIADSVGAIDVAIDMNNPAKVFAAMWERQRRSNYIKYGGIKSGLYVSTDSGDNWSQVSGGFPANDANLGRISFDISKSNSEIIYALLASSAGDTRGMYKSTDGGLSWVVTHPYIGNSANYAWFNRICRVFPTNPDKVFCGAVVMDLSVDGGVTFNNNVATSHVDQHAIAIASSNPDFVVIGNDGGIDYSTNGGTNWQYSNSLPITQFYAGEIDFSNPQKILGGTQDNGTYRTTNGGLNNWTLIYGNDGFYCLVDYNNPLRVYASSQNGRLVRSTNGGNSGGGFVLATTGIDLQYTNWMTPFAMDKNNPLTLYCGTYKIHKTTNAMESWTVISPDLANDHVLGFGTITTLDAAKSNPDVIYCGTDDANVWVTTNAGTNWIKINADLPNRWVTRVAVHPDSANVCYVTLSGFKLDTAGSHIFRTVNYGTNWTSIGGNLPDAPINDIVIDPGNTNTLYIGTDLAVMFTINLGASWNILGTGIPSNVPCHDLTLHNPTRTLIAWTHGRSAFKIILPIVQIENNNSTIPSSFKLYQNYPNPFNPKTTINYEIPSNVKRQTSNVRLVVYDVTGKEIVTLVNEKQNTGTYSIEWDANSYPSGSYFYSLYGDNNLVDTKSMILLK